MVFLDATYRTTRYAIPLFFVCVHTNCGYCVVATLILEREDTKSVAEALAALLVMNPGWSPSAFMVDSSEVEMNAIASVFPGNFSTFVIGCVTYDIKLTVMFLMTNCLCTT